MNNNAQAFNLTEAVALAAAQVAYLGKAYGIDFLIIKGPGATHQGVRPTRESADVDVMVRERDTELLVQVFKGLGWIPRPHDKDDVFPSHSTTLYHPQWPCDIDVHHHFPGFETGTDIAFDALWERRTTYLSAGHMVNIPDRNSAALIQALHSLRASWLPVNQMDYNHLKSISVSFEEIHAIAARTGSLGTARPYLKFLSQSGTDLEEAEPSQEWKNRQNTRLPGMYRLHEIRHSNWKTKFRMIARALYPSDEQLASKDISVVSKTFIQKSNLRAKRIGNFLRYLPTNLRRDRVER